MKPLIDNARSFAATHVAAPENAAAFQALESGQAPQALFITCSDSRVVPTLITGARPGELFELRTAGNVVPPYPSRADDVSRDGSPVSEAATIEYAVCVLGVRDIVVCGHSHCGAVGALVRGEDLSAVPAVRDWLDHSVAPDAALRSLVPASADVAEAVQTHVLAQVDRLRAYPCVSERIADGSLTLHAWYYEVHTGNITAQQPSFDDRPAFGPL
ncbi:carbonic anhydrase [Streptomyces longisporoflavus]|uniref:carbonic anhydrase n=1 Tax=Streptomyces longisporoflavus TaxID=28044 RepID=UPI00167D40F1|nr:carbonic anhydrase [Streptomyces longisporoflavus]GGV23973.1 carbonic anhydrase [Streptomyces longisporoflavus]